MSEVKETVFQQAATVTSACLAQAERTTNHYQ
jgi:hypothetical protein